MAALAEFDVGTTVFAQAVDQVQKDLADSADVDALGTALARGIELALASPEAAVAMLRQIGIDARTLRAALDVSRAWLAAHPITLGDTEGTMVIG